MFNKIPLSKEWFAGNQVYLKKQNQTKLHHHFEVIHRALSKFLAPCWKYLLGYMLSVYSSYF